MTKKMTKQELQLRLNKIGSSYKVVEEPRGQKIGIKIKCARHGIFTKSPNDLLKGRKCPKCPNQRFDTKEIFIEKARKIHGLKYDYSKAVYVDSKTPIAINCAYHGRFKQTPRTHLASDHGCQLCAKLSQAAKIRASDEVKVQRKERKTHELKVRHLDNFVKRVIKSGITKNNILQKQLKNSLDLCEEFVRKATAITNYSYNIVRGDSVYEVWSYCGLHQSKRKIKNFEQHLMGGTRCVECQELEHKKLHRKKSKHHKRLRIENNRREFIRLAKEKFGDQYDYSKFVYTKRDTESIIVCSNHGQFLQSPQVHLHIAKHGCPKCARLSIKYKLTKDTEHFITLSRAKYGDEYDYSKSVYKGKKKPITITCKKHGDFKVVSMNHMHTKTNYGECPTCRGLKTSSKSNIEKRLADWMRRIDNTLIVGDRKILKSLEIDMFVPSKRVGVELNGVYWHSTKFKDVEYHKRKAERAWATDVKLLQFWEHELYEKPKIVKSIIKGYLGKLKRFDIKSTVLKRLSRKEQIKFFNDSHIEGAVEADIIYGLFLGTRCLAGMSFTEIDGKNKLWSINRFSYSTGVELKGAARYIWKYFIKKHKPIEVTGSVNLRLSYGCLLDKLGFIAHHKEAPRSFNLYEANRIISRCLSKSKKITKATKAKTNDFQVFDAGHLIMKWYAQ